MSTVFVMLMGVTIVAVEVAVAEACPKELVENAISSTAIGRIDFFILGYGLFGLKEFSIPVIPGGLNMRFRFA
jgi:hypothetical protein